MRNEYPFKASMAKFFCLLVFVGLLIIPLQLDAQMDPPCEDADPPCTTVCQDWNWDGTNMDDFPQDNDANENLDQGENGDIGSPISPVFWQNGNLNPNNSHFVEGHSVPYRATFKDVPTCVPIRLTLEWDVLQSGHLALDFITNYQQLEPHEGPFGHASEDVDPLTQLDFTGCSFTTGSPTDMYPIPDPMFDDMLSNDVLQDIYADYEAEFGEQYMTVWGAQICDIWYGGENGIEDFADLSADACLYGGTGTVKQQLTIEFFATSSQVIFAWGGHIARFEDWGTCSITGEVATASGLSGSPYHMRLDCWTLNNIGQQDRSLKIDAVFIDPDCDFEGAEVCEGESHTFTGPYADADAMIPFDGYEWTLVEPTNGAIIDGSNTEREVTVIAGTDDYQLQLVTTLIAGSRTFMSLDPCVVTVIVDANPSCDAGGPYEIDCNSPNGEIMLTATTDATTPSYSWSTPDGFIVSGANTATPTVNAAGTYNVTITDEDNGCTSTCSAAVTLDDTPPDCDAGADKELTCTILSVTLDGSSTTQGATFSWSGPGIVSGGNTATPTVNAVGTYILTVTDPSNGCTSTCSAAVTLDDTPPDCDAGADKELTCTILSVTLDGSSTTQGATFSWSGPGIVSGGNTATPTVNAVGTYILTVTDPSNGCTSTCSAAVTLDDTPPDCDAGADKELTCTILSVTLDGSSTTQGATFSWSGPGIVSGGNTATPTVNAVGTYILTVTDPSNGCTSTCSAAVTLDDTPPDCDAGADKELTCTILSVTLDGSSTTQGATFSWSGPGIVSGGNTATPTVNAVGTYILTVTDPSNGCTSTCSAAVTLDDTPPDCDAGADKELTCTILSVTLDGSSTTQGATFSWSGPGIVSGGNTATPTVNAVGTYILTVTDPSNGCTSTCSAAVTLDDTPPDCDAGADKELTCTILSVTLDGSSTTQGATFSWSGPGIVSGGNTATPTVNAVGTYILTVTDPSNGCTSTCSAAVTLDDTPPDCDAGADKELTCTILSVTLDGSSTTQGATFSWSGPGIVSGGNTATPTVNAVGTYILTVTDPSNGCTSTCSAAVTLDDTPPDCDAGADKELTCTILSVTLDGSSTTQGATFSWSGPGIVSGGNTATPTVNAVGTYILTVTDPSNGCTSTCSAAVTLDDTPPDCDAGADKELTCTILSVTLDGSSTTQGATFSWSGPGIVSGGNTATPTVNAVGTYILTVTDPSNGCTSTCSAAVTLDDTPPDCDAGADKELTCTILSVTLDGSSTTQGATFSWSGPGIVSGGNTATPTVNAVGTYILTVTDPSNGCTSTCSAAVTLDDTPPDCDAGADKELTCTILSVTLDGSSTTQGATFSWSGPGIVSGGNTATPTVNAVGTYILTVTDPSNGCTSTCSAAVTLDDTPPDCDAGADKELTCTILSVTLDGSSTTQGATFSWSGPGIVSGGNTATPTVNAVGTYILTVTDPSNGCTSTCSAVVTQDITPPDVNCPSFQQVCLDNDAFLLTGATPPGGIYSGQGVVDNGDGTYSFDPSTAGVGVHTITYTYTDPGNGCDDACMFDIEVIRCVEECTWTPGFWKNHPKEICGVLGGEVTKVKGKSTCNGETRDIEIIICDPEDPYNPDADAHYFLSADQIYCLFHYDGETRGSGKKTNCTSDPVLAEIIEYFEQAPNGITLLHHILAAKLNLIYNGTPFGDVQIGDLTCVDENNGVKVPKIYFGSPDASANEICDVTICFAADEFSASSFSAYIEPLTAFNECNNTCGLPSQEGSSDVAPESNFQIVGDLMEEVDAQHFDVTAFPNPTSSYITLKLDNVQEVGALVQIRDALGRMVEDQQLDASGDIQTTLNLSGYAEGLYFVRVRTNEDFKTLSFIVARQ